LANAFRDWSGVELPVVDEQGRLLGTVWRDDFVRARRPTSTGTNFDRPRRANDCVDHANTLHESSSIAHAVEALASRRARTLILVQGNNAVAGVLTDLDLLRWFAQERRRLSEVDHERHDFR
jgi:CBS-domain-containing membrane protein